MKTNERKAHIPDRITSNKDNACQTKDEKIRCKAKTNEEKRFHIIVREKRGQREKKNPPVEQTRKIRTDEQKNKIHCTFLK